jgi:hypothetical protein
VLHELVVLLVVRVVSLPAVALEDRLLLAPMELPGLYRAVMRWGYSDKIVMVSTALWLGSDCRWMLGAPRWAATP